MKRISFSEYDAEHLYELAYENFQPLCSECQSIKKRLEKFLGVGVVKFVKRNIKKYPYGN